MVSTLEWAEIRTPARDRVSQREIVRRLGIDRRTVDRALRCDAPPRCVAGARRFVAGSVGAGRPVACWSGGRTSSAEDRTSGAVDGYRPARVVQFDTGGVGGFRGPRGSSIELYALPGRPRFPERDCPFRFRRDAESFMEGHVRVFDWLGGVPRECVYDNLRSVVAKRDSRQVVRWNQRFLHLRSHYAFHSTACTPSSPREKGSVEGAVWYLKTGGSARPSAGSACPARPGLRRLAQSRHSPPPARDRGAWGGSAATRWSTPRSSTASEAPRKRHAKGKSYRRRDEEPHPLHESGRRQPTPDPTDQARRGISLRSPAARRARSRHNPRLAYFQPARGALCDS